MVHNMALYTEPIPGCLKEERARNKRKRRENTDDVENFEFS